ncbi:MAG: LLM class flavin-dependent oxidoreductase [Deltaproteobacteria bacterium]|nr:LLM class flavin-dependent oxidoreductase [Deltaproteobacteria bacterium]
MQYDIFFSISQTPAGGVLPTEAEMYGNFFEQVEHADRLGFGVAWVAESHLSSQVQKRNKRPVIPHWEGEVGLNCDVLQLATRVFARTERIEVGSAVMNILCMGGPVTHAERIGTFCALHGLDSQETRRLHIGFASGRFDFMNEATGIGPRDAVEAAGWRAIKGLVLKEAATIFLRLLRGDIISSAEIPGTTITREQFRSDEDWERVQDAAVERDGLSDRPDSIAVANRWDFEYLKVVPADWRRELLQLVIGSHDPSLQDYVNEIMPVQVFNLSITRPEVIEATHTRMARTYHDGGGAWARGHMPRTVFVFLNHEDELTPQQRSVAAREEATEALSAYWKALQGTIDPDKVNKAADNALVGNVDEVATQIRERFHPEDRLMLWFDFFNHDSARVMRNMSAFMNVVRPLVEQG